MSVANVRSTDELYCRHLARPKAKLKPCLSAGITCIGLHTGFIGSPTVAQKWATVPSLRPSKEKNGKS